MEEFENKDKNIYPIISFPNRIIHFYIPFFPSHNLLPGLRWNELRILAVGETVRERSGDIFDNGEVGV